MTAQSGSRSPSLDEIADDDDPRIQQVYRRLRVLTLIGALTMGVGFMAVMSVIAYRLVKSSGATAAAVTRHLDLANDARVVSTATEGGRIVVTTATDNRTIIYVFDAGSLVETGRLEIGAGAKPAAAPIR